MTILKLLFCFPHSQRPLALQAFQFASPFSQQVTSGCHTELIFFCFTV